MGAIYDSFINATGYKAQSLTTVSTTNSSCNGTATGSIWGDIGLGAINLAAQVGEMALLANAQGGGGPSHKQISKAVAQVVSGHPQKIASAVASFNARYAAAGVSMKPDGTPSKTYAERQAELNKQIADHKASYKDDSPAGKTLKEYNDAKAVVQSLDTAVKSYDNLTQSINNYKDNNKESITVSGDDANPTAKGVVPQASEFVKFLSKSEMVDEKGNELSPAQLEEKAKGTQAYQTAKQKNEDAAAYFNNMVKQRSDVLKGAHDIEGNPINDKNALDSALQKAEAKVKELSSNKLDDKQNCGQYDATLEALENQLKALGDKTDFDKAVNDVKELKTQLEDALKVQSEEVDVKEARNAKKNTPKREGNFFKRLFGKKTDAYKEARDNYRLQRQERNEAYAAFAEKYS